MQRVALALCFSLSAVGCSTELPGEVIGTYQVKMTLKENTCGPNAVYISDGSMYSVQLRADGPQGYWRLADGKPLPGKHTEDHKFTFMFSSVVATSDADAGSPLCQLAQTEVLSVKVHGAKIDKNSDDESPDASTVDAGDDSSERDAGESSDPPTTLTGTHELNIAPTPSSDCRKALHPNGPFALLPCKVIYTLRGQEREDF